MKLPKEQQLPKMGVNFELRQMARMGENPIHQAKLEKTFELKKPKLPKSDSPWVKMGGKK